MRSYLHRTLYALGALLSLCFSGLGFASAELPGYYAARYALTDVGYQGKHYAQFKVEQVYMAGAHLKRTSGVGAGLVKQAHGYLQLSANDSTRALVGSVVKLT